MSSKLSVSVLVRTQRSLVAVVRIDQRQERPFEFAPDEPDVARVGLAVDNPGLLQFREVGVGEGDPDASSMFVGCSCRVFVPNPVCNAVYERVVRQRFTGCSLQ